MKFKAIKDKVSNDVRAKVLTFFPRFLAILEDDLTEESPVWDVDFKPVITLITISKIYCYFSLILMFFH